MASIKSIVETPCKADIGPFSAVSFVTLDTIEATRLWGGCRALARQGDAGYPRPMSAPARNPRLIALIISAALFMGSLDANIIATALPQMARAFRLPPVELSLGMTVYILVMAAFLPISTWVADRLGARRVFAAAIVAFALTSALCGFSRTLPEFVGARALQALAATLMAPVGNLVLFRSTEKRDLVAAVAISTTPALIAPAIGPAIGGFIVTFLDWPWIFFLNVPISVLGVTLALRFIPDVRDERRRPFDWPGFLLSGLGLGAL